MKQQMLEAEVKELKARIEALKAQLDAAHDMRTLLDYRLEELVAQVDYLKADAAAIRNATLREASEIAAQEGWPSRMSDAEYEALTGAEEGGMDCATRIEAAILALIDNPRKDVMPDATQSPPAGHDIGPGDQAVAGAADYAALRQDIRNMAELYEIYGEEVSLAVDPEIARSALSYLDTYEGGNWPSPRILVENNSIVLTWEIGNWKLYQYCDDEPQKIFRWVGTPPARDASNEG
jgi:hypothetical protein